MDLRVRNCGAPGQTCGRARRLIDSASPRRGEVLMTQVAAAGGEIYYEETGEGEPLVFVSGLSGLGRYWQPQVPVFSARFRVITYDQRGTGASDRLQRVFSIDQMAAELAALMDAMRIERAHIVGLSTGGAIAQTLAITNPDRVARLVICGTCRSTRNVVGHCLRRRP